MLVFVDIGGMVDDRCSNFLFINCFSLVMCFFTLIDIFSYMTALVVTVVDLGFDLQPSQIKENTIDFYRFSAKHAAFKSKSIICCLEIRIMYPNGVICLHVVSLS